jgi:hydrogenase maturation protease
LSDSPPVRLLIQCIGNRWRGDDAAGPLVAERLRRQGVPDGVQVRDYWGEGSELMQDWEGLPEALLVDCATSGAAPGTLQRIDLAARPIPTGMAFQDSHRFGVAAAVETARALGRLPPSICLYAVEGTEFRTGAEPTAAVLEAVERLVDEILKLTGASVQV